MSVAVQLLDERRVKVRAKSHVCGSMTVSCNLVRVLILEIFMMAGRVLFGGIIRLRLSHGGVIMGSKKEIQPSQQWQVVTPHLGFILHTLRRIPLHTGPHLGPASVLVSAYFDGARVRQV